MHIMSSRIYASNVQSNTRLHDKRTIPSCCIAIHCTMYFHSCKEFVPVQPHSHNTFSQRHSQPEVLCVGANVPMPYSLYCMLMVSKNILVLLMRITYENLFITPCIYSLWGGGQKKKTYGPHCIGRGLQICYVDLAFL